MIRIPQDPRQFDTLIRLTLEAIASGAFALQFRDDEYSTFRTPSKVKVILPTMMMDSERRDLRKGQTVNELFRLKVTFSRAHDFGPENAVIQTLKRLKTPVVLEVEVDQLHHSGPDKFVVVPRRIVLPLTAITCTESFSVDPGVHAEVQVRAEDRFLAFIDVFDNQKVVPFKVNIPDKFTHLEKSEEYAERCELFLEYGSPSGLNEYDYCIRSTVPMIDFPVFEGGVDP